MQAMLQTTICDGLAFDPFSFEEDSLGLPEVDVSRSEIAEALVIASMVVVLDATFIIRVQDRSKWSATQVLPAPYSGNAR
jgi:hypothetical protein